MRIDFERTGGFAAIRMAASIDTETLDAETVMQLQELVEAADFFNLPTQIRGDTAGADRFQYRITVETDVQQHTVHIENAQPPEALNALIGQLMVIARSQKE